MLFIEINIKQSPFIISRVLFIGLCLFQIQKIFFLSSKFKKGSPAFVCFSFVHETNHLNTIGLVSLLMTSTLQDDFLLNYDFDCYKLLLEVKHQQKKMF